MHLAAAGIGHALRHQCLHVAEQVLGMGLDDELHTALAADLHKHVGQHGLGQRVQVDLGLLQQDGAARWHKIGHRQHRQHLGHPDAHVAHVGGHTVLVHQQLVVVGAPHLAHLDALGHAHFLQPVRHTGQHRALVARLQQRAGGECGHGFVAVAAHRARAGFVPHIVTPRLAAQRPEVNDGFKRTPHR